MQISQKELISNYLGTILNHGSIYIKTKGVWAKIAEGGEEIITIVKSGEETRNIASKGDYIITNDTEAKEKYIAKKEAFDALYKLSPDKPNYYLKKRFIYALSFSPENFFDIFSQFKSEIESGSFKIEPAWGGFQRLQVDDFLALNDTKTEINVIAQNEFYETYIQIESIVNKTLQIKEELVNDTTNSLLKKIEEKTEIEEINDLITKLEDLITKLEDQELFDFVTKVIDKKIKIQKNNKHYPNYNPFKDYQKLAKSIYKDSSISSYEKFDLAIDVLNNHCDLKNTTSIETLGIAGAIFKNKWKFDNQFSNLIQSKNYYERGHNEWLRNKDIQFKDQTEVNAKHDTYCSINLAHICYILAAEIDNDLITNQNLENKFYTNYSNSIWNQIITFLKDVKKIDHYETERNVEDDYLYWDYATIAEAYFSIDEYENAEKFGKLFLVYIHSKWKIKTFRTQLIHLLNIKNSSNNQHVFNKGISCLNTLFEIDLNKELTNSKFQLGLKKGIGLSGGGFRAAFYHIGVLAAMAEEDELRDLEVISCVSGGSIIGAFYYCKLKLLLESKEDTQITKTDYISLIKDIETEFLEIVQKNILYKIFQNPSKILKMIFSPNYTYTDRLAEIYNDEFYAPIFKSSAIKTVYINELRISPKNDPHFYIHDQLGMRKNKVPQLILNASSVNTGHNFQFTASWLGEPPYTIKNNFDSKPRLRRVFYKQAPDQYKKFTLGKAVGASSCVPILFEPVKLSDLYPDISLRLVDGGVTDNQGIVSLLEQECKSIIISDGSSQMAELDYLKAGKLKMYRRVDSILQERLREIQLIDISNRQNLNNIKKLKIVHLKNGLDKDPIDWIGCNIKFKDFELTPKIPSLLLSYNILEKIQVLLSQMRTALDTFSDNEANALMLSGYKQMINNSTIHSANFNFKNINPECVNVVQSKKLEEQLLVSTKLFFKFMDINYLGKILVVVAIIIPFISIYISLYYLSPYFIQFIQFLNHQNILLPSLSLFLLILIIDILKKGNKLYKITSFLIKLILFPLLCITMNILKITNKSYNNQKL